MRTFIHKPWVAKTGRYIAAYALFAIFAILGILILFRVRSNIFDLCVLFSVNSSVTYLMYSWGTYILFIPYVFFIALLEPYLNKAARTGQVFARSKKVFIIEASIGLITLLISLLTMLLRRPPAG